MKLSDALFNWLQIAIVADARPADKSAHDTVLFFEKMLEEDHEVAGIKKEVCEGHYILHFSQNGETKTISILRDSADSLLKDILAEPKYN